MKKNIITALGVVAIIASVSRADASNVGFGLGINLGNIAAQVYAPPQVASEEPPQFVAQPGLGFSFAVGTPNDLFYVADSYYLCRGNMWYAAPYYNGPWVQVGYRSLPWALRRYPIARLRYIRNEGCRHHDNYEGARWGGGRPCGISHDGNGMRRGNDDY